MFGHLCAVDLDLVKWIASWQVGGSRNHCVPDIPCSTLYFLDDKTPKTFKVDPLTQGLMALTLPKACMISCWNIGMKYQLAIAYLFCLLMECPKIKALKRVCYMFVNEFALSILCACAK